MAETGVLTLAGFLLARIAEDEAVARAAATRSGSWELAFQRPLVWGEQTPDAEVLAGGKPILRTNGEYAGLNEIEHVLSWDPARVLTECAGKRRAIRQRSGEHSLTGYPERLDPVLLGLAAPYVDHPDYREEWRP